MEQRREFHALAELFPLLRGAAFAELVADIQKNGLLEPILVDAAGRILDGRNRYRACLEAGVEPRFVESQAGDKLVSMVLSRNLHRRHLDESQRALVAARLAKLMGEGAIKRRGRRRELGADLRPIRKRKSASEAAAIVNVSPRLVTYALKVVKDGCDELIAAVESGGLAVTPAATLAGLPHAEQAQVVAGGAAAAVAKARELRGGRKKPAPLRPSAGCFGVLRGGGIDSSEPPLREGMALLWVPAEGLAEVIAALEARGFQYSSV